MQEDKDGRPLSVGVLLSVEAPMKTRAYLWLCSSNVISKRPFCRSALNHLLRGRSDMSYVLHILRRLLGVTPVDRLCVDRPIVIHVHRITYNTLERLQGILLQ